KLGVLVKQAKAFKESADEFNAILSEHPNYGPAYRELAETYYLWANAESDQKEYEAKINQALQYYEKYMDLTDRSLESRMRHADFLILAKKYAELEKEAQAMAQIDKANPRIYRYLGYAAFENGNYQESIKAIKDFMAKVEPERIIPQDYLFLGRAQLKSGADSLAMINLRTAVELDSTNAEGLSEIAKDFFDQKQYAKAAELYELSVQNPKASLLDYFYLGSAYYWDYGTKKNENLNPSKEILVKADTAFSHLLQRSPTTEQALLYRSRIHRLMDDAEDSQGLAVPYYEQYIELVTVTRPEKAEKNKAQLVEAYTYLGSVAAKRDRDNAKAK